MSWNFKFWEKTPWGAPKEGAAGEKPAEKGKAEEGKAPPKLKGFQKRVMKFLQSPEGAEAAKKIQEVVERMKKEGVDVDDEGQVKAWIEKHKSEFDGPAQTPHMPFVHDKPLPGRNDPCLCGSGKKFKKCCEGKKTAA